MSLLAFSRPLELSSSSVLGGLTFPQTLNDGRSEVSSFSLRITCGARRRNYLVIGETLAPILSFQPHNSWTLAKMKKGVRSHATNLSNEDSSGNGMTATDEETYDLGVRAALSLLKFYRREISPLLPSSCRYVPTCSVYSMEAYKRYGSVKGTILTAWRLCRCNPLGGHGFDPPRWFGEQKLSDEC